MLDHVGLDVSDYERSKAFYEKTLAPLGWISWSRCRASGASATAISHSSGSPQGGARRRAASTWHHRRQP